MPETVASQVDGAALPGVEGMHLRRIEFDGGPSVCGFEGCVSCARPRLGCTGTPHHPGALLKRVGDTRIVYANGARMSSCRRPGLLA